MFQKPKESKKNSSADKTEKIREIYRFFIVVQLSRHKFNLFIMNRYM